MKKEKDEILVIFCDEKKVLPRLLFGIVLVFCVFCVTLSLGRASSAQLRSEEVIKTFNATLLEATKKG